MVGDAGGGISQRDKDWRIIKQRQEEGAQQSASDRGGVNCSTDAPPSESTVTIDDEVPQQPSPPQQPSQPQPGCQQKKKTLWHVAIRHFHCCESVRWDQQCRHPRQHAQMAAIKHVRAAYGPDRRSNTPMDGTSVVFLAPSTDAAWQADQPCDGSIRMCRSSWRISGGEPLWLVFKQSSHQCPIHCLLPLR